jgi:hypothetical protein
MAVGCWTAPLEDCMKDLVTQMFSGTFRSVRRILEAKESGRHDAVRVMEAMESVVEATDPAIRFVRGYKRKLYDSIAASLRYAERVVSEIPGALEVSRTTFLSDPYVNAFFVNTQDLQTIFSRSSEIREFLENCPGGVDGCYALLCMHKSEKTVFGVDIEGDMLKHDVRQTAVSFSDHRLYSPAGSEKEVREGLRHCLFHGLTTHALERIMHLKLQNHRLQEERHALSRNLRGLQSGSGAASGQVSADAAAESEKLGRELAKIDKALLNSRMAAPEESLTQVQAVFKRPDGFVRVQKSTICLNKMCIKVGESSQQPHNRVDLTEVTIGESPPRVVTLARFPGDELLPPERFEENRFFS